MLVCKCSYSKHTIKMIKSLSLLSVLRLLMSLFIFLLVTSVLTSSVMVLVLEFFGNRRQIIHFPPTLSINTGCIFWRPHEGSRKVQSIRKGSLFYIPSISGFIPHLLSMVYFPCLCLWEYMGPGS